MGRGPRRENFLRSVMWNPASVMSSSTLRFRLQPPPIRFQVGLRRSCQTATHGSGARPCSTKITCPPEDEIISEPPQHFMHLCVKRIYVLWRIHAEYTDVDSSGLLCLQSSGYRQRPGVYE